MKLQTTEENEEKKWKLIESEEYLKEIDIAMLSRLISALKDNKWDINADDLKNLCYGKYSSNEFDQILHLAEKNSFLHEERQHED
jgi:hypothetical protein